jgi:hypothetical protein
MKSMVESKAVINSIPFDYSGSPVSWEAWGVGEAKEIRYHFNDRHWESREMLCHHTTTDKTDSSLA